MSNRSYLVDDTWWWVSKGAVKLRQISLHLLVYFLMRNFKLNRIFKQIELSYIQKFPIIQHKLYFSCSIIRIRIWWIIDTVRASIYNTFPVLHSLHEICIFVDGNVDMKRICIKKINCDLFFSWATNQIPGKCRAFKLWINTQFVNFIIRHNHYYNEGEISRTRILIFLPAYAVKI